MSHDEAVSVDYTAGHIDFSFNQGDSIVLSFQFLDHDMTVSTKTDVPASIAGYVVTVNLVTDEATLPGVIARDEPNGVVVAEFDQKETDKLHDRSKYRYTLLLTDADGREFRPVKGYVYIGRHDCGC
jgi:hypothetical protein